MRKAFVLSLVCVLGLGVGSLAASLTGSWDTDVTIDPQQTGFDNAISLTSEITVVYTVGDWELTSITNLTEDGWADQDFSVAGVLGAFSISSDLGFLPDTAEFDTWQTEIGVSIAGVSFSGIFYLHDHDVALLVTAEGVAGDVTIEASVGFGGGGGDECDLDWGGTWIGVEFPFCCANIAAVLAIDCDGFEFLRFQTEDIAIPNLPWLTIDAEIEFTMDKKTVTLEPDLDFGDTVCFDLDIDWTTHDGVNAPLVFDDLTISGISLECDIGAVSFTGVTDFTAEQGEYFEWYIISTNDDGCCGPFSFDLGFYFLEGGARLFDVALIDADVELQIASQFTFNMGLEVNVQTGAFTEWLVGFLVTW